jgi:hypothetical protein
MQRNAAYGLLYEIGNVDFMAPFMLFLLSIKKVAGGTSIG